MTDNLLAPVLAAATAAWDTDDVRRIAHACRVAERLHRGQLRRSGDPEISHLVEVATIVAGQGASADIVCAALLHDVLEDTQYTIEELRDEFGPAVAGPVQALTRLTEAEVPTADREVLLLKLADRLHNMRTIAFVAPDTQRTKSTETLRTLVPLARRLGLTGVGEELTELANRTLHGERRTLSSAVVRGSAVLLPRSVRARWLAEWAAELATLPTRRATARFAAGLVIGMPRLAWILRSSPTSRRSTARLGRRLASTVVGGVWVAATVDSTLALAAAAAIAGCIALAAAVLFTTSDEPARRLRELIESWRNQR